MGSEEPLDLRRLRYFLAVVRLGTLTGAARDLNVAQPALSLHIEKMEAGLGVQLFRRSSRGMHPTEAGRLLSEHASSILSSVEIAKQAVRDLGTRTSISGKELTIALPPSMTDAIVPALIAALERVGIRPIVREAPLPDCHVMVDAGEVDCAVTVRFERWWQGERIVREPFYLVSRATGTASETISFSDVMTLPLILPIGNNFLRRLVDDQAAKLDIRPRIVAQVDGLGPRKSAVMAGLGNTILGWINIAQEVTTGALQASRIVNPDFYRLIVFRAAANADPALIRMAKQILRDLLEARVRPSATMLE